MSNNKQTKFGFLSNEIDNLRNFNTSNIINNVYREELLERYVTKDEELTQKPIVNEEAIVQPADSVAYTETNIEQEEPVKQDELPVQPSEEKSVKTEKEKNEGKSFFQILSENRFDFSHLGDDPYIKNSFAMDILSDVVTGAEKTFISSKQGDIALNNHKITELEVQKDYLQKQQYLKILGQEKQFLEVTGQWDEVREIIPEYNELLQEVINYEKLYKHLAGKHYGKVGYLKKVDDRLKAIDSEIARLKTDNQESLSDLQEARSFVNKHAEIYKPSKEWEEAKQKGESLLFQIPEGIGSSINSLAVNFAVGAATTWAMSSPALTGGPYGAAMQAGAAIIGGIGSVVGAIWSRDLESRAEVAGAYNEYVQEWATKNKVDIEAIAEEGRKKLSEVSGQFVSNNPNDINYRNAQEVFEDMLAYDIPFEIEELDKIKTESRKYLQNVYNKNMTLMVSDVALAAVIIPGAGKFLNTLLGELNVAEKAVNATVKLTDKAIETLAKKTHFIKDAHKISKYISEPVIRVSASGMMEGLEEVQQAMITNEFAKEYARDKAGEGYYEIQANVPDLTKAFVKNNFLLAEGVLAMAGLHGDPALNNKKELVDQFLVGTAIGLLMGGGTQIKNAYNQYVSYDAGRDVARHLYAKHFEAKEDMEKYTQYALKALGGMLSREAFIDAIDQQIKENAIPDGWTINDINKEKQNITDIYDIVNNHKYVKQLSKEKRAVAAALVKHIWDRKGKATADYNRIVNNTELSAKIDKATEQFVEQNNLSQEHTDIIKAYIVANTQKQAVEEYLENLEIKAKDSKLRSGVENIIIDFTEQLKSINSLIKHLEETESITKKLSNDDRLMGGVTEEIKSNIVDLGISASALKSINREFDSTKNKAALEERVDKYLKSLEDDKTFEEEFINAVESLVTSEVFVEEDETSEGDALIFEEPATVIEKDLVETTLEISDTESTTESDLNSIDKENVLSVIDSSESVGDIVEEDYNDYLYETYEAETIEDEELSEEDFAEDTIINQPQEGDITEEAIIDITETSLEPYTHTSQQIANSNKYDKEEQYDDGTEKITEEGVKAVYRDDSDETMVSGYEPGKSFDNYASTPGNLEKSTFGAFIGDPNGPFAFNPKDRNTWDNAAVYVEVIGNDGKKYVTALQTIDSAIAEATKRGVSLTEGLINELRKTRNDIIEAKLTNPDAKITFSEVYHTHGLLNVNRKTATDKYGSTYQKAIYRPVYEVKGFNLPKNPHDYTNPSKNGGIRFGYGKGIADNFLIVDRNGQPLPGHGGSGKIFIYPAVSSTLDRISRPIQLTEQRFANEDGTPNKLAQAIAHSVIYQQSPIQGIPLRDFLALVINYGEDTILEENDPRVFMLDKQFYIDYSTGYAQLGKERIPVSELRTLEGEQRVAKFITDNLHWNTDKNILFGRLPESFRTYLDFNNKSKLELFDGAFIIDREDVGLDGKNGLDGISYLIKHGLLKSDLKDQIYHSPLLYVRGVNVEENLSEKIKSNSTKTDNENVVSNNIESAEEILNQSFYDAFFGIDEENAFKTVSKDHNVKYEINTKKAKKRIKRMLGDVSVDVETGVIRELANGDVVVGVAYADSITLSEKAEAGVEYHEAWHRVSLLMLTPLQRKKLYNEFRKENPKYKKLNDKQIEEIIADQFMDYMIASEENLFNYYVKKAFRAFKQFINFNKNAGEKTLLELFEAVRYGDFKDYKINEESLKLFKKTYGKLGATYMIGRNKEVEMKTIKSPYEYQQLLHSLLGIFVAANKVRYVADIHKMSSKAVVKMISAIMRDKNITDSQREVLKEVLEKFETIREDLIPVFQEIGTTFVDGNEEYNKANREEKNNNPWSKESWEYRKKDNALGNAKLFLHTIPDVYYIYREVEQDGKKIIQRSKPIQRRDPKTGLPLLVDYDTAFSNILKYLSDVDTFLPTTPGEDPNRSLLGKCALLGETDAFFAKLYNRLCTCDPVTETQLLQVIKSFSQNFEEIACITDKDGNTHLEVRDSIHKRALQMYPSNWSDNFFNSNLVDKTGNVAKTNTDAIKTIINEFNTLYNEALKDADNSDAVADKYLNKVVELFNKVGITVDKETFEIMLDPANRAVSVKELILDSKAGAMKFFFQGTLDNLTKSVKERTKVIKGISVVRQLDKAFVGLGQNSFITRLATAEAQVHPIENQTSVLGPNGNLLQIKTLNCFVSDQIRWLNQKDQQTIVDLTADPYNSSSLILKKIKSGGNIKLNTFVNFYSNRKNDSGRAYTEITPTEDYVAKMAFTHSNHIVFPTMADKGTWFTISGINLFNDVMEFTEQNGKLVSRMFDRRALIQLYNNLFSEFMAINKYYATLPDVKVLIENYHTKNKGGLFRHFGDYGNNLNKRLENAFNEDKNTGKLTNVEKELERIRQELFSNPEKTLKVINRKIAESTKTELDKCIELGLIEKVNGVYKNKLLDNLILNKFKTLYSANSIEAVRNNAEHYAIITMVGNFNMNYQIGVVETEKMFTGDLAFYKSTVDQTKRLGAVLSTGDNLRTHWIAPNSLDRSKKELQDRLYLQSRQEYTSATIEDNMIASAQYELLKKMFQIYYVRELLKEREGLTEHQIDKLKPEEIKTTYPDIYDMAMFMGSEDAEAYGFNEKRKQGNINQADASVYVSPQMYKDILQMLGEWNDETEEAFAIMEGDQEWLNDSTLYQKAIKALIKPLKTTYFCNKYNSTIGRSVPVFNKMAMFPLFKVFASGDLSELYDRMNAVGKYEKLPKIDQIAFESAVKVGIEGKGKVYTDASNTLLNDLKTLHTTSQRFRNLRRQLITDPHHSDRTLFGTQVSTVAASNLVLNRIYQEGTENEVTGVQLRDRLFGTINAISNHGAKNVAQMYLDENGKLSWKKASKQLIKEAMASNMGMDLVEALKLNKDESDFTIPLSALPDSKWVETKLISSVNKEAVDLNLPGGAFIQMSSFGIKSIKTISDRKYAVNNGKRLVNINEDGSMDCVISINLLKHIIPDYNKMSFIEARNWLIDHGIIGEKDGKLSQPMALGYRIPTQGMSSIAGIRVADVLPESVGDTIILPDEFTAQTGSDFDIDKLYIARYNYDKNGKVIEFVHPEEGLVGEQALYSIYDKTVKNKVKLRFDKWKEGKQTIYDANTKEANENLLLRTYLDVLTDKKNVGETRLPLDKVTKIITSEMLPIVEGKNKTEVLIPSKEITPSYQLDKKYEFSSGKTGIGPFALNNKNHILTQLVGLNFVEGDPLLEALGFTGLSGVKSVNELVYKRDENGKIIKDEKGEPITIEEQGIRILDWLSAMINAHVDVAKDPYIIKFNVCQYTYNIANFLFRVGFGKNTLYFLPLPILKEMSAAYNKAMGVYGVDPTKSSTAIINEEIIKIRKKYIEKYNKALSELKITNEKISLSDSGDVIYILDEQIQKTSDYSKDLMKRDVLIDQIQFGQKDDLSVGERLDFYRSLLLYSQIFSELNNKSEDMSKLVRFSQIDTKKYGGNFVELDRFVYSIKALINNTTLFKSEDLMSYYQNTFLYTKLINGIVAPSTYFEPLLLRSKQTFKDAITEVLIMINRLDHNDSELNKIISNELEAQIRMGYLPSDLDIRPMFYGPTSTAAKLSKIKADIMAGIYPELKSPDGKITNGLLNILGTLTRTSTDAYLAPTIITKHTDDTDKKMKAVLKEYWLELLDMKQYPEIQEFARELVVYTLVTTGGNFTKHGLFGLLPISAIQSKLFNDVSYAEYMQNAVRSFSKTHLSFDNFFMNNWHNDKLVKPIKLTEDVMTPDGLISKDRFTIFRILDLSDPTRHGTPVVLIPSMWPNGKNVFKQNTYQPFLKVRTQFDNNPANVLLYKFVGTVMEKSSVQPVYVLVNKKGLNLGGRVIKEYDRYASSAFPYNNHKDAVTRGTIVSGVELREYLVDKGIDALQVDRITNTFVSISDYMPTTRSLRMWFTTPAQEVVEKQDAKEEPLTVTPQKPTEIPVQEVVEEQSKEVKKEPNTFTFADGFVIKTPFELNPEQKAALFELEKFIKKPKDYNNNITLTGYAGTGKTTIIGLFDKYLKHLRITPRYSAPTHRANAATKQNNPKAKVYTLHKLFGLRPDVDLDSAKGYDLRSTTNSLGAGAIEYGDILIIDESSMISDELFRFLQAEKKAKDLQIVYIGDPAQLAPVKNNDKLSPVFIQEGITQIKLTKVERTGDNPILEESTNLRNGRDFLYRTKIINGEGVEYTNDPIRLNSILKQHVDAKTFIDNPMSFRILSATNDAVEKINRQIQKMLFGNISRCLEPGTLLMGYANLYDQAGSLVIQNSLDYKVISVKDEDERNIETRYGTIRNVFCQEFEVIPVIDSETRTESVKLSVLSNKNSEEVIESIRIVLKQYLQDINDLWKDYKTSKQRHVIKLINTLQNELTNLKNSVLPMQNFYGKNGALLLDKVIDYGYAHTIHKSQGGTYDSVVILADTINMHPNEDVKQQLKYVAMSRAKRNVVVVTKHKLEDAEIIDESVKTIEDDKPTTINVYSQDHNGYEALSNFANRPFEVRGIKFKSVEQAFQATKAKIAGDENAYRQIMAAQSPAIAKSEGTKVKGLDVAKWDVVKYGYMKTLMKYSFQQNPEAKQLLLSTGDATLTHKNTNGVEQYGGMFSKILTEVREELKKELLNNKQVVRQKTYKGLIDSLKDNQVFVFGSNTEGRHGKGAALIARKKFGAIYGQAEGPQGQSYAIITKDLTKATHPSRTPQQIIDQINKLYDYAKQNADKEFIVAYSGNGSNLNAYSNEEMASFFASQSIPNNIVFEESFSKLVEEKESIQQNTQQFDIDTISDKTEAFGVELAKGSEDLWNKVNDWMKINPNGIVAYRKYGGRPASFTEATVNDNWIGNPFSTENRGRDTVLQFYDWLVTGNNFKVPEATEQFRQAIINKILATPKDAKIFYFREWNRPSHATVIGYLINNKELLNNNQNVIRQSDVNNTESTNNDPVNFSSVEESVDAMNSPKTILTNEEALKLRPFVGDMPRIAVASEHTDPVFFSKKIIRILNGEESVEDKFKNTSYTGKDFNALYLITKHDGLPLKELLEQPIPKIIHFSITGLGGTKWEPGVMKPDDLLDRIEKFIEQGLDPKMVTVRIDPIVPGVTKKTVIENIVARVSKMGINKIRYSVMDRYKTTSKFMESLGYDYGKYYPQGGLHATQEVRDAIDSFMVSMKEKYNVNLFTCAEPNSKYADKISKEACLSVAAVNKLLGTSIPETTVGKLRQLCSCFGGKTDLLRYDNKCASSCVYCYAHHNVDKNLNYYNEDGTLKNNLLTSVSTELKDFIAQSNANNIENINAEEFTNHSGGAYGGDTMWDLIGRKYKVTNHKHYRDADNAKLSKTLDRTGVEAVILTKNQMEQARAELEKLLGEKYPDTIEGNLKVRNYYQVANADAVYAIAKLNTAKNGVSGGTNVAVQLGIKLNKPVYVWDLTTESWYKFDGKQFSVVNTPTLTKNFAGVGTRDIEDYNVLDKQTGLWVPRKQFVGLEKAQKARKAIDDVYKKTFEQGAKRVESKQLSLFNEMSETDIQAIQKQIEEHNKKCNR